MAEEAGTNTVTKQGREHWDYTKTGMNEVNLSFEDDKQKVAVTEAMENILCAGNGKQEAFLQ